MDCHSWRRGLPEDGGEAADLENSVASVRSSRLHLLLCVYVCMCVCVYMCVCMYNVCIMPPCCLLYVVSLLFILSQIIILHCDLIYLVIIAPRACADNPMMFSGSEEVVPSWMCCLIENWYACGKVRLLVRKVLLVQKAEFCISSRPVRL